ncbi:MAG TPA: branched-chain amino acid ABC transporter permease [Desulfosarcina sp.]|nr:branched-chain amino acid ABC transporter permease [Desulfosarcina sp.]
MNQSHRIGYAVFLAGIIATGLILRNPYHFQILTFIGINTLLALGLNMLMGYAGQISLGHAAFFGIGAYTTAILTVTHGLSPWISLPCAVGLAAVVAYVVGVPTLKLSGYYLGMGTLGFGMIGFIAFREWDTLTGGASGFVGIPPLEIGPISFASPRLFFFLVWAVVMGMIVICRRIIASRMGRALRSIHDSEKAARAVGIDTMALKLKIFVFSAGVAALAGFLYAHYVSFISPGSFDFLMSVRMVTMVVIGGMASIWGALLGASLLTLLPEWLHAFSDFEMVVYGLIMMVVMILMPQGLTRGILDLLERIRERYRNEPAPS